MKTAKGQEVEIETIVESTPYEEGIVVVEGFRKAEEEEEGYEGGNIKVEDPDEIIEPGSTVLYEEPRGGEEYKTKLRERLEEYLEQQEAKLFTVPEMTGKSLRHSDLDEPIQEIVEAYDKLVMGVSCGCCMYVEKGHQGQFIQATTEADTDAIYATPWELVEISGQQNPVYNGLTEDIIIL